MEVRTSKLLMCWTGNPRLLSILFRAIPWLQTLLCWKYLEEFLFSWLDTDPHAFLLHWLFLPGDVHVRTSWDNVQIQTPCFQVLLHPCHLGTSLPGLFLVIWGRPPVSWILCLPSLFLSLFCWSTSSRNSIRKCCRFWLLSHLNNLFVSPNILKKLFCWVQNLMFKILSLKPLKALLHCLLEPSLPQEVWFFILYKQSIFIFFLPGSCSIFLFLVFSNFLVATVSECGHFIIDTEFHLIGLFSLKTSTPWLWESISCYISDHFFFLSVLCLLRIPTVTVKCWPSLTDLLLLFFFLSFMFSVPFLFLSYNLGSFPILFKVLFKYSYS